MEVAREWILKGYKVRTILRICHVPRSTYYYQPKEANSQKKTSRRGRPASGYSLTFAGKKVRDHLIKHYIEKLLEGEESAYGYRRITTCLRRKYKLRINKKKVYRLCKEMKILAKPAKPSKAHPRRLANNMEVTGPNQLWQLDIKYGYVTGLQRHFYTANIIDVYDRHLVGCHRGKACDTSHVLRVLQKAILMRGTMDQEKPLTVRTDNGPQFISHAFGTFCESNQIIHERTPNRTPNKNAYVESYHSTLERECFKRNIFMSYEEAFAEVDRFVTFYNERRIHSSLYDYSPKEFLEKLKKNEVKPFKLAI
ncbi:IS3 family transposase [Paenibacillus sp. Root444D2]|uniref:IS3 family transposase n=1 Tax=Paenibacillus sp. Root444D2 TaxID=1736538 RepID=UPI0007C873A8|nr:IS3 family transposase [Paenibacillus sp. Root444D2]